MAIAVASEFQGPDLEQDEYYDARIKSAEDVEDKYNTGPRVLVVWAILDERGKPAFDPKTNEPLEVLDGVTVKAKSGSRSKFYQIWNACFFEGKGVPDDEEMDSTQLPGQKCRLLWGMVMNPSTKQERPGIFKYAPIRKAGGASKRAAMEDKLADAENEDE
jgi:hypothetical protein